MSKTYVYRMDDYYWFAANNKRDAIREFKSLLDSVHDEYEKIEPKRLSGEEMESLTYYDDLGNKGISGGRTFAEELAKREAAGETPPYIFAVTSDAL